MARRIAVYTSGRQDWNILRSTCLRLAGDARFALSVIAGGMHLASHHGRTLADVERDVPVARRLDTFDERPAAEGAKTLTELARALAELAPEVLLLVGDRAETLAAGVAATLAGVAIAHLHGGEETEGAVDNAFRHALTKLAHLHLVSHPDHARRVRQLGEPDDAVAVVGAPGLDNLHLAPPIPRDVLARELDLPAGAPLVVVTHHPTTAGGDPAAEAAALVAALAAVPATYLITLPNNDAGAAIVRAALQQFCATQQRARAVEALGPRYFAVLRLADAIVGNSSSALIEAPLFQLPAVNVGDRQKGRLRGANVIDAGTDARDIEAALRRALDPAFRASLAGTTSPFGDGRAAERIVEKLASWRPPSPLRKRFVDRGGMDS